MADIRVNTDGSVLYKAIQSGFREYPTTFAEYASGAGFLLRNFAFTRNTLDLIGDQIRSESLRASVADGLNARGTASAGGDVEMELLVEDYISWLAWSMGDWHQVGANPPTALVPTSAGVGSVVADETIASTDIEGSGPYTAKTVPGTAVAEWPGQIDITTSGTGTVIVEGFFQDGAKAGSKQYVTEEVPITAGAGKTKNFFIEWKQLTNKTGVTGKPALVFKPDTKYIDLRMSPDGSNGFRAIQGSKGVTPFVLLDASPQTHRVTFGANIRVLQSIIGTEFKEEALITDLNAKAYEIAQTVRNNFPDRDEAFNVPLYSCVVFGRQGETLSELKTRIENTNAGTGSDHVEPYPFTELNVEIANNLSDPGGYTCEPKGGQPTRGEGDGVRQVILGSQIFHEIDDATKVTRKSWQDVYRRNLTFPAVAASYGFHDDGRQTRIQWGLNRVQLIEVPGLPIEGRGTLGRRLAAKVIPAVGATQPNEMEVRIHSKNGYKTGA